MTSLELIYFDIPGKGEAIRLAAAYAGLPLVDNRISREEFVRLKENGELKYGQVPALRVNGTTVVNQSAAIMRYLGRITSKPGLLYPTDPLDAAFVDSIVDQEIDLFTGLSVSRYKQRFGFGILDTEENGEDAEKLTEKVRKELNDVVIPRHLENFEKLMSASTTGWIANTETPSIADFILVPRLVWLREHGEGISESILDPYKGLVAMMDKLLSLEEVKAYYASLANKKQKV